MTRSIVMGFVFSALAAAGMATGCGDDNTAGSPGTPSGKGESCTRTADCKSGLLCIDGTCLTGPGADAGSGTPPPKGTGGNGGGGSGSGGSAGMTPAPVLSGEGESCTRRADCESGLACVLQTCTSGTNPGGGEMDGGSTTTLPTLGQRGESCQSVRDCAAGLTCFPRPNIAGGICDVEEYGLKPTGKTCGGECTVAKDCCELPPNTSVEDPVGLTVTPVSSCADLIALTLGGDPTVCDATPSPAKDPACFYYKTYCDCAANIWACTDNKCQYAAKCAHDGNVFKGCPTRSRSGVATTNPTCDTTAGKCQPVTTGCSTADDCETLLVFDDSSDTCEKDECTCVAKHCYRKCDEDLDCPSHFSCDTKQSVCTPTPACTDNSTCAASIGDVRAECSKGRCILPCTTDHDCSPSGVVPGAGAFGARVCNSDGVCEALGCTSDDECSTPGGLRSFCVTPVPAPAGTVHSAVTD